MKAKQLIKLLFLGVCLITFFCAIAGLYATQLSFENIKQFIDSFASDGDVESFTAERFQQIAFKIKLLSIVFIFGSATLFAFSKKISAKIIPVFLHAFDYANQKINSFRLLFHKENRVQLITLLTCLIVGCVLRLNRLFQPTGYDEAFSYIYFIKRPIIIGLSDYSYPNNHLFHTLLSHISCGIFGNDLWAIRLPAFIAGVLIIPFTYFLGKKLINSNVGLLAAACCAVAAPLIDFSVIARGYTLVTLFYIISFILSHDIKTKQKGAIAWFILVSILGLYTVPIYLQALLIQIIWIIVSDKTQLKKALLISVIIFLCTALLYLPPIITSGLKAVVQNDTLIRYSFPDLLRRWGLTIDWLQQDWLKGWFIYCLILLSIGFIVSFVKKESRILILITASVILILSMAQQNVAPTRGWLHHLPILFICCAAGIIFIIEKINRSHIKYTVPFLTSIILLNAVKSKDIHPEPWGQIAETESVVLFLKQNLKEGDRIISFMPTDYPLEYYMMKHDIPIKYLRDEKYKSTREFIVINLTSGQSLNMAPNLQDTTTVRLVKHFEFNDVYLTSINR